MGLKQSLYKCRILKESCVGVSVQSKVYEMHIIYKGKKIRSLIASHFHCTMGIYDIIFLSMI